MALRPKKVFSAAASIDNRRRKTHVQESGTGRDRDSVRVGGRIGSGAGGGFRRRGPEPGRGAEAGGGEGCGGGQGALHRARAEAGGLGAAGQLARDGPPVLREPVAAAG